MSLHRQRRMRMIKPITRKIEIVVEDSDGARSAAGEGADSIELCVGLDEGGLTPPVELMRTVTQAVRTSSPTTECHFLILNKADGFYVTAQDVLVLKKSICDAKESGADGVVFGALTQHNTLDMAALKELVAVAAPMKTTFHRAFDRIIDQHAALEQLIDLGFTRLLTSGKPGKAIDHGDDIRKLVDQARGRIVIVAGGGIRLANIETVAQETHAPVLHMSCRVAAPDLCGLKRTDAKILREVVGLCRKLRM